jgi:hypothetical protein
MPFPTRDFIDTIQTEIQNIKSWCSWKCIKPEMGCFRFHGDAKLLARYCFK